MTAPFFLVARDALTSVVGAVVVIDGPEGRHAAAVRRLEVQERVMVGDGCGAVVDGVVTAVVGRDRVEVTVSAYTVHVRPTPQVVVVQALAKGERAELSVELLTEVGVDTVVPWSAQRSVVQWRAEKAERGVEKWRATAREATKQSRRPYIPDVRDLSGTSAVAVMVGEVVAAGGTAIVLHESVDRSLAEMSGPWGGDVLLVVGPEGGITEGERAIFETSGAVSVRLGPSVLRTSTAGAIAAALILASCGRWN